MKTSIATVSLSGDLTAKLEAIAAAGFDGYELFENDLTFSALSPSEVQEQTADLGLTLFALQPFRDFEGLLDARRSAVFERAERKFDLMDRLGTDLLLIPSSVSPHAVDGVARAAEDLRELGERAKQRGVRIGYEALAWGRHVRDWTQAWEIVRLADHDHVGLVLDTYHLFVRGNPVAPIRNIPAHKIVMVQLADAPSLDMEVLRHSRHLRNFPGQGDYPIVDFVHELVSTGYDGVISHEIFNDEFRIAPPEQTATDGYRSMMWLQEEVHRSGAVRYATSKPPSWIPAAQSEVSRASAAISGVAFVEFAVTDGAEASELRSFFKRIGFAHTHRHKTKRVDLYSSGGTYLAINAEPDSHAGSFADRHGAAACAIGLTTDDPERAHARALAFLAEDNTPTNRQTGEAELRAVAGVGDVLTYFVSSSGAHFVDTDFVPIESELARDPGPRLRVDHVGIAVAAHELLSALLFYRAVLGFDRQPIHELTDPHGLVTSRAVQSQNAEVRIALSTSTGSDTSPERFRAATQGSGVQHIAFATPSIVDVVRTIDPDVVLAIPANYYVDLEARFGLDQDALTFLRRHNVLYDRTDDGIFFHLYTREIHGVFFEFVERAGYHGFGAANAPVRLAAQSRDRG